MASLFESATSHQIVTLHTNERLLFHSNPDHTTRFGLLLVNLTIVGTTVQHLIRRPSRPSKFVRNLTRHIGFQRFHDSKYIHRLPFLNELAFLSSRRHSIIFLDLLLVPRLVLYTNIERPQPLTALMTSSLRLAYHWPNKQKQPSNH